MSWAIKGMKTIQQSAFQSMASQQQYTCPLAILRGSEPVQDLTPADSSLTPFIGARVLRVAPSALLTLHRTQSEHPHSPKSLWALINASVHELYTIALKFSLEHYPQLKKKKTPKANFRSNPGGVEKTAHIVHKRAQLCKHTTQISCLVPFPVIVRTYPEESKLKEEGWLSPNSRIQPWADSGEQTVGSGQLVLAPLFHNPESLSAKNKAATQDGSLPTSITLTIPRRQPT